MTRSGTPSVVVSHPGVQQSYETAAGLQSAGLLHRFITSIYRRSDLERQRYPWRLLPARQREMVISGVWRRWHPAVDARLVQTIALPFLAARGAAEVLDGAGLSRFHGIEQWGDVGFDALVARALRRTDATQVHAFEGAALYTLRAAKRRGLRTVLDVPSAHEYNIAIAEAEAAATGAPRARQFGSSARVRAERLAADVIVTPSAYVSRCLLAHGVDASKIVEVPFGADPELYTPPAPTSRSGRFVLLDVASINHRKGTRYLLQAWRELALPDGELVLAGAPDDAGRRVLAEYEGSYRHVGHVAGVELPALFRSASAFVLPSLAEGSALVTYMAMASALPVIVTEDAGSVATDGREGWVVPSRDVEALKAKILHLYQHRTEGAEMGAAGRKLIEDRYTWRHYHRRIAALHRAMHDGLDITQAVVEACEEPAFARAA